MTKTLHVFIDTNIFLSFFAYTGDDIEQLKTLVDSIQGGAMRLYLPRQVVAEFDRNRERRIKESIEAFAGASLSKDPPRLLTDYPTIEKYKNGLATAEVARDALVAAVREDARARNLAADQLFHALCEAAGLLEPTAELIARARERKDLGHPPGKNSTIGDQLNWETLLDRVEDGVDLHLVSRDGDYRSALFSSSPHRFLVDEWRTRKGGDLVLHAEIKLLLKAWFPAIKLQIDKDKAAAIEGLVGAGNFAATHQAIEKLTPFIELLTPADATALARAASENSQINWIAEDPDVLDFYRKVLPPILQELPTELREEMLKLFDLGAGSGNVTS